MAGLSLVFRAGVHLCAVGPEHVVEVMRPLPVRPLAGAPPFVRGVAVVRATATPVLSVAAVLGEGAGRMGRFVTIRDAGRMVALAVDEVVGLREIPPDALSEASPLLGRVSRDLRARMGALDGEPLLVLDHVRVVPDSVWRALDADRERAG